MTQTRNQLIWQNIKRTMATAAIVIVLYHIERPPCIDSYYLATRWLFAMSIQILGNVIYQSSPRAAYRIMLEYFSASELESMDELPTTFDTLSMHAIITLGVVWAKENLLQSRMMYERFVHISNEISRLKESYDIFMKAYSATLISSLTSETAVEMLGFMDSQKEIFYAELEKIASNHFTSLTKRREQIIAAFFVFYKNMCSEPREMEQLTNA